MNYHSPIPSSGDIKLDEAELLVTASAAAIQISENLHTQAETNYNAIATYIDKEGSPLYGHVLGIFPSGSFAIGAAILGKTKSTQHDVDAVLVLQGHHRADPLETLKLVKNSLLRPDQDGPSRYAGKVSMNSRCVTVTYDDGRTVDIMPVCEFQLSQTHDDERHYLFHYKKGNGIRPEESYHKPVRPKGFKRWYKSEEDKLTYGPAGFIFESAFQDQVRAFHRGVLTEKAETESFPENERLLEKTIRTIAIQLIKRNKQIGRRRGKVKRTPPSVLVATLGMKSSPQMQPLLIDEVIHVASYIIAHFTPQVQLRQSLELYNPSWEGVDLISDRWGSPTDMAEYCFLLKELVEDLEALKLTENAQERKNILMRCFGENVSIEAITKLSEKRAIDRNAGKTAVSRTGSIVPASLSSPAVAKTKFYGGG